MMPSNVYLPASIDASKRRYEERIAATSTSVTVHSDIFSQQIILVDVTRMGFLAKSLLRYKSGELLTLHMPAIRPINASAAWFADGMLGARFISVIDDDAYASLLGRIANQSAKTLPGVR
jgi:hypothetical protein